MRKFIYMLLILCISTAPYGAMGTVVNYQIDGQ